MQSLYNLSGLLLEYILYIHRPLLKEDILSWFTPVFILLYNKHVSYNKSISCNYTLFLPTIPALPSPILKYGCAATQYELPRNICNTTT